MTDQNRPKMEWREQLKAALASAGSAVILGIGNELMGDDGAGALVAKRLEKLISQNPKLKVEVIEAGTNPENFTGPIARMRPDLVLMVDAADMGRPAGEVAWLPPEGMRSMMHTTHTMPLSFLADYIRRSSGARVAALGIQAARIDLEAPMTPEVVEACRRVAEAVEEELERGLERVP